MAAKIESGTTIARPIGDVFQFVLDLDLHPSDPGIESVVKSPNGPTGPGTTLRFTHSKGKQTTMRFTAVEPCRRIGFDGKVGPLKPAGDFHFAQAGGQTRLMVRVAPNPPVALKPLFPLVNRIGRSVWDARLARIKAALEAPAA